MTATSPACCSSTRKCWCTCWRQVHPPLPLMTKQPPVSWRLRSSAAVSATGSARDGRPGPHTHPASTAPPRHPPQAPAEALHTLLHALAAAPPTESHLSEAKVVLAMEGLPSRAFSSWAAAFVPSNSSLEVADPAVASQWVSRLSCREPSLVLTCVSAALDGASISGQQLPRGRAACGGGDTGQQLRAADW